MLSFHREGYKIIILTFLVVLIGILFSEKFIELFWLLELQILMIDI
jgi:phosphatidylserine decarboxylase